MFGVVQEQPQGSHYAELQETGTNMRLLVSHIHDIRTSNPFSQGFPSHIEQAPTPQKQKSRGVEDGR